MDVYQEFLDPSRISSCIGCNFISPNHKNLIVAKGSILQIFETILLKQSTSNKPQYRLKLIEQFKLQGTITDIKAIRTSESPSLDYLIISTKFAKFSIIKWDHQISSISTVSLHYYEDCIQNSTYEELGVSELILEPTYNSVSCLRYKNLLCFLPFDGVDNESYDDDDDDKDEDDIDEDEGEESNGQSKSGPLSSQQFYDASFILDASNLDSSIDTVVDMQFLHNYRDPTIAILSQKAHTWAGNLIKLKDNIQLILMTLDIQLKSTLPVFKIDNLPYDIDKIIPLPSPLNGCLLIGCNEVIHVDNGGLVKRIAVNSFTSLITSSVKSFQDQSDLNLKLEDCTVVPIPEDHRVLLVTNHGEFYFINFELDGRSIKKIFFEIVDKKMYNEIYLTYPGEAAVLDKNLIFFANMNGDNPLVQIKYRNSSKMIEKEEEVEDEMVDAKKESDEDDDDDDIYKEEEAEEEQKVFSKSHIEFILQDKLVNNGPISSFTLGLCSRDKFKCNLPNPSYNEVSIVSNAGSHKQGKLNIITPTIQPDISSSLSFSQVNRMWNLNQTYLITSDDLNAKSEIFQIEKQYTRMKSKDFINNELTINVHELNNGKFILQITPKQILLFDSKFKVRLNLNEEIKDDEILSSTLRDELLMIFLASGDVKIFSINTYKESYSKVEIPKLLEDTIITTGYITKSHLLNAVSKNAELLTNPKKRRHSSITTTNSDPINIEPPKSQKHNIFVLVTGDNRIVAFNRHHNEKCYQLNDISKFSDILELSFFDINQAPPDPFIKQVILNDLGDKDHEEEYLTVLTIGGEIYLYKLFFDGENYAFKKEKDLKITGAPENAFNVGTMIERRLVYFPNLNGFTSIFVTGVIPFLIIKSLHSIPRIYQFSKIPAVSISAFSDSKIQNGLIFLDNNQNARICQLSLDYNYEFNLPIKQIHIGESIKSVTYHEQADVFVISTFKEIPYDCVDEENQTIVGVLRDKPPATSFKGYIKLISPYNWTVIDVIELQDNEVGMTVQSMVLDVGSSLKKFKNKKEFIVIGTGKLRMEDLAANGSFKIYEIIDIIPEPGKPETNHKFKEVFQEDTRGTVTNICDLSGRFLVAQGQKVIVRDLQDDGVVPVAFLDTPVYVSEAKSFGNLLILGDPLKSIWFIGFEAEPFRMVMLGKDTQHLNVECSDFIVKDEEIYVLVADNRNVLHLIQYDPDDPSSINGTILLNKASFHISSTPTCMRSIPKGDVGNYQVLGSTLDGSFFNVFPVNEATYRRMYILQQQLSEKEYHYCGLNPRMNRLGSSLINENEMNSRPMLDYTLIKKFTKLNLNRQENLATKINIKGSTQEIWKDIIELEYSLEDL
ncbi:CFT1 [Candida pseudojiufengensis]|uniref:CFT1 n=1 Tax=Candida pseudojiufengensis TaxID=497109 RepID=UPI002223F9EE|nr:CFT1 [Candida pseudojiufengensis]KAI5959420.1 CFT1 [Candida pseudojiufengensis]